MRQLERALNHIRFANRHSILALCLSQLWQDLSLLSPSSARSRWKKPLLTWKTPLDTLGKNPLFIAHALGDRWSFYLTSRTLEPRIVMHCHELRSQPSPPIHTQSPPGSHTPGSLVFDALACLGTCHSITCAGLPWLLLPVAAHTHEHDACASHSNGRPGAADAHELSALQSRSLHVHVLCLATRLNPPQF
jgi:hypothetical protein